MADDLVKRLRKLVDTEDMHPLSIFAETIRDAADAIETLTRERDDWCDAARSEADRVNALTRERDDVRRAWELQSKISDTYITALIKADKECDALRALLREAGKALELLSGGQVFDDDSGSIEVFLDVDDIHRARAVLARIKEVMDDSK